MIAANVDRVKEPFLMPAYATNRGQYNRPLSGIQTHARFSQNRPCVVVKRTTLFAISSPPSIVVTIDRALGTAMQSCSVTGKRNQVSPRTFDRPLRQNIGAQSPKS